MIGLKMILPGIAGAVGASVGTSLILRSIRQCAEIVDGGYQIRYGRSLRILTWGFWACYPGSLIAVAFAPTEGRFGLSNRFWKNLSEGVCWWCEGNSRGNVPH